MAYYLVKAKPSEERMEELYDQLESDTFRSLRPFGNELTDALLKARYDPDAQRALWEEEDYCTPPLAQEREAVLDDYFDEIEVERVRKNEAWERIDSLPSLWEKMDVT